MGQMLARNNVVTLFPPAAAGNASPDQGTLPRLVAIGLPRAGLGLLGTIADNYGWMSEHINAATQARRRIESRPAGYLLGGAFPHDNETVAALSGCRKLLLLRDLRSLLVSRLRAERQRGQWPELAPVWHLRSNAEQMCLFLGKAGPALFNEILSILLWIRDPDSIVLRFDALLQPGSEDRSRIDDILSQGAGRLYPLNGRVTPRRPATTSWRFADYWSDEAEAIFAAFGGPLMNRLLGYEQPASSEPELR